MKIKITYALLLLLCCTLGASSNKNSGNCTCDALKNCTGSALLPMEKSNTEAGAQEASITEYLPGYSIIFMN